MVKTADLAVVFLVLSALLLSACTRDSNADLTLQTDSIRIAAAANLSDVLPDIIISYQKDLTDKGLPEPEIAVTYASSGKLYAQIKAGAPYDLFLSANQTFPATLAKETLAKASSQNNRLSEPFTYARGQLALYSVTRPVDELELTTLAQRLTAQTSDKITIANPTLAPYGESAKAYLQAHNIYDSLIAQKRLIQAENISQAFQYAHTGSVDYGFVAQSQLIAIKVSPKQFYTLPVDSYPAILQDGIVISDVATAIDFAHYLQTSEAQQSFIQAGYLAIP